MRISGWLLIFAVVITARIASPCGPYFETVFLEYQKHPDFPIESFINGRLGIIRPTYRPYYLYIAYRNLQGPAFTSLEKQELLTFISERTGGGDSRGYSTVAWDWQQARAEFPEKNDSKAAYIDPTREHKEGESSYWYENCPPDAFRVAVLTLRNRAESYGKSSAELQGWLEAQDAVFHNCHEGRYVPSPLPPAASSLARADREYQIAAAHFYSEDWDRAADLFLQISNHSASPWQPFGKYLAARAHIRKASLSEGEHMEDLRQATFLLNEVVTGAKQQEIVDSAQKLKLLIELRSDPVKRFREIVQALSNTSPHIKHNLTDLLWFESTQALEEQEKNEINEAEKYFDMTKWMNVVRLNQKDVAIAEFQKTRTVLWLVAAMGSADGTEEKSLLNELLSAAGEIPSNHVAYPTIKFHQVRLLVQMGAIDESRRILDESLGSVMIHTSPSTHNAFLRLRMMLAETMEEFLRYAPRSATGVFVDDFGKELPFIDDQEFDFLHENWGSKNRYLDIDSVFGIEQSVSSRSVAQGHPLEDITR